MFVLHHIFFHLFTCKKCSRLREEGAGSAPNDVNSMSPKAMRALLVQSQTAMASLLSKIDKMSIQGKGVVPDLTSETIKEVMAKPQMASWMRHCRDALQDYVAAVDRPVARPTSRQGGGCDTRDRLACRAWSVLVESQCAYAEKFANPAPVVLASGEPARLLVLG